MSDQAPPPSPGYGAAPPPPPGYGAAPPAPPGYGPPAYAPPGYYPVPLAPQRRRPLRWVLIGVPLLVVGIIALAFLGYLLDRQPLDAPPRLAGLERSTDPEMVAYATKTEDEFEDQFLAGATTAAVYGAESDLIVLIAAREDFDLASEWRYFEKKEGRKVIRRLIAGVECGAVNDGEVVCMWRGDVSGLMVDLRAGSTVEQAAAAANEAKDALN
jgi:hypothetical protein